MFCLLLFWHWHPSRSLFSIRIDEIAVGNIAWNYNIHTLFLAWKKELRSKQSFEWHWGNSNPSCQIPHANKLRTTWQIIMDEHSWESLTSYWWFSRASCWAQRPSTSLMVAVSAFLRALTGPGAVRQKEGRKAQFYERNRFVLKHMLTLQIRHGTVIQPTILVVFLNIYIYIYI